ncbi:MAG: hypothetical protein HOL66_04610 [Rhodospirillaceae bacterium]|jgi:hypothetical protein|nr:hypothetical protein [Rhodospirillaceae bacterium]MBT5243504.1 hypothetical protein [Rhodospirillaceae bacterium]MBT5562092.1 hypothetical protein [Rhodospirillaceae bacterium]MBT6242265.1 hypothetical protein [Rhodospirillaceae bacterium]MBT7136911.1 hypothetical protein [Rhodospirillaceae bacterium]
MRVTTGKLAKLIRPAILAGLLLLPACTYLPGSENAPPCPLVSTLGDAEIITRYIDGPGRDLVDLDFTGRISNLSGKCFYEIDDDTGEGVVRVKINTEFKMERGAGNKTREAAFEYFVSLLDGDGNVLDKLSFPFTAKYWKNRYVVTERDAPVELSIPLTGGLTGDDFSIYVGFQLNREELDFNRGNIVQ